MKKTIGIIAPSSVVPKIELELSVNWLQSNGFDVRVHPQTYQSDWAYAGSDQDRANAFLEFAYSKKIDLIWCARGGYGATHLLPLIHKRTKKSRPPRKSLYGFSDVTALHSYVQKFWRWNAVHSPMPSMRTLTALKPSELEVLLGFFNNQPKPQIHSLKLLTPQPFKRKISLPIYGGNLAVWCSLIGTEFLLRPKKDHFLFFEDIHEAPARILRMIHQLQQAKGFENCKGILLGDFTDCKDSAPQVLSKSVLTDHKLLLNTPVEYLKPLRPILDETLALKEIANRLYALTKLPVYSGVPSGHGQNHTSIPFGTPARLNPDGILEI